MSFLNEKRSLDVSAITMVRKAHPEEISQEYHEEFATGVLGAVCKFREHFFNLNVGVMCCDQEADKLSVFAYRGQRFNLRLSSINSDIVIYTISRETIETLKNGGYAGAGAPIVSIPITFVDLLKAQEVSVRDVHACDGELIHVIE